ncbi:DNA topoisomerase III [Nitrosomonas sp.]|uniref:DNA topoisomerase III n=1 Tax=Nitrosomonas sp. TaxID=42353 RepID=UPI001E0F31B1|nr:DNA topoisomerase III [Nitrosomonas sp.]MBX3617670.1 DNA topoisomerase III [Nitrosomonas sp.]
MGKSLIIAEKPSVAADIAKALGGFTKHTDYFENDQYVISSAIGHLLELVIPKEYEVKRGKWSFANLPVIPPHFALSPIEKTSSRLTLLNKLIKRKDVDMLINACDAGREGELIFYYILRHAESNKPIKRLWLQSMTPDAIRGGFTKLLDNTAVQSLAEAAVSRSESDWLVGINGTRAMTAFNSQEGGFHKTTVGRVQTPTLAILVEREEKIKKFHSQKYWEVHATFATTTGSYTGRWFDEKFNKNAANQELKPERLWEQPKAEAIRDKCMGKPGTVSEESKPSKEICPLLYDLTSLQREANGRFGFSAKTTLGLAQALYEKHKVLTYPRTDSRALPEDYIATVKDTLQHLSNTEYGKFSQQILASNWVVPNKRIFNNSKISDHFAIIPTALTSTKLNEAEAKLYDLVMKRFLAIFFPAAEYLLTTRITRVEMEPFKTEGKVLVNPGWQSVYGKLAQSDNQEENVSLVAIKPGETTVVTEDIKIVDHQTRPPARFTEATLLSAMEGAGKFVEDEELRAAMSAKGLGTPATRAAIIEGLVLENYIQREGRELHPTAKAFSLITLLRGLKIPELISPELTGNWEFQLRQIEQGHLKRSSFMEKIAEMTKHIVEQAKSHRGETISGDFSILKTPCPKCGGHVHETYKKFQCQSCDFALWKILAGRQFEVDEMETLITQHAVGPLQGFRSKMGQPFNAIIRLTENFEMKFDFGNNDDSQEEIDFSNQTSLGKCPKCGHAVYEHGLHYVCEKAVGANKTCSFKTGKIILERPIEREQISKLLETGKTDLLTRFISKKGRPFSAYLIRAADGKIGFEFEQRTPKKTTDAKPKTKTSKTKTVRQTTS